MDKYHKTIIFSKIPLEGYFLYPDRFLIYPADLEEMPKSEIQEHYPLILEYIIDEHEVITPEVGLEELKDLRTLTATTLTKQDEILNLLTLFTNHVFFRYTHSSDCWGIPILKDNPGEEANKWSSKWIMKKFHWPELPKQLVINDFTKVELIYKPVEFIPFMQYYQHNPNYDSRTSEPITFPNNIFLGIEAYYSLDEDSKYVIDTAISHTVSAIELQSSKKTLSVISAFTAIETMVNYENKDFVAEKCEKCGQLQYKISQHYRDFLLKYIGNNPNNKKKFNALYDLRSKIVHTGMKLKTEYLWNDLPQEEKHKEMINQLEVILLSKMSIANWLIINNSV